MKTLYRDQMQQADEVRTFYLCVDPMGRVHHVSEHAAACFAYKHTFNPGMARSQKVKVIRQRYKPVGESKRVTRY